MSALPKSSATPVEVDSSRPRLHLVPRVSPRMSNAAFFAMVGALVALGLIAVMITTTQVAAQSKEITDLRREATELEYDTAAYNTQLQALSSPESLAGRAGKLGMVPNPYPAFLNLDDGTLTGNPRPVVGNETPWLQVGPPPAPLDPLAHRDTHSDGQLPTNAEAGD